MSNFLQLKSSIFKIFFVTFFTIAGILLFQAQDYPFNDNDPSIEQPTREAFSHFRLNSNPNEQDIITIGDFDNFDAGIDNYEQYGSSNPTNPLWLFFGVNASPQNARGTTNGGLNWYLNNPQYPGGTCCDPWATHTGNGVLIYASGVSGQYIYRSTNNGLNWSSAILSVSGVDRNHVSAEYTGNGPYANYVYACITPGNFGRSTDAGLTWTTTFNPSNSLPGCYIAVGPNGSTDGGCVIYVTNTGSDFGNRVYNFYRSTNGGSNFTLMSSQSGWAGFVGTHTGSRHTINNARTAPHPKIAMDNSNGPFRGRLYHVHASNDPPGNGNKPDIWLRYSTDQGATWSARVRVNDNPDPTLSDQWFPEIFCERTTGKLYIHWYDDRSNPSTFQTDLYATYTTDGGQTFAQSQRLNNQTFTFPNPPCSPNCYRGDYTTMMANNPKVGFSVWSDHRNATAMNMGSYFPDFAMRVNPASFGMNGLNDSAFVFVGVPAVKLYSDTALFSAVVTNPPVSGSIILTLLNKTSNNPQSILTSYPDSLRLRVKTSGVPNGIYNIRVLGNGPNGTPVHQRFITVNVGFVGIVNNSEIPEEFNLYQNYPNPFNPTTKIVYHIPKQSFVKLVVYDILGKEIATLVNKQTQAGSYEVQLDASSMPSGVYFYKITAGDGSAPLTASFTDIKKMILIK
ncbi:MAG: T9SS type A sorting domain-containing protein [Chlorobi bacterium]|nr:T9SS type A sorting domain-containing protein [Chlorobiota bacterium]MCI0715186.1 T9SS type A sorting domain-containing protein [Chlorobiota bacterium]